MTCFFCRGNAEQTTTEYIEKIDNFVAGLSESTINKKISLPAPTGRGNRIKCIYTHVSRSPRSV